MSWHQCGVKKNKQKKQMELRRQEQVDMKVLKGNIF